MAGMTVDNQAVQELQTITGTFNAEYGQALSGVINTVTKRGDFAMIEQDVDLTGVETLMFDVKTGELYEFYSWGQTWSYDFIAEALVDNTRVWATSKEFSTIEDIKVDVSSFTGKHTFKFRLFERENGTNIGSHTFE